MTGDEKCIGSKYGITFTGRWVWRMKDHIDVSFMNLFSPYFLFKDYDTKGTAEPVVNTALFDTEDPQTVAMKAKVAQMSPEEAGQLLSCGEEETEFKERLMILMRMHTDKEFELAVVDNYDPPYYH